MNLLAIDTAASLCSACVWQAGTGERSREVRDIGKGHAEQLVGVVGRALSAAGTAMQDLDAIAVTVGPGSFTGVRVGVSYARGLALALNIPAVGSTTLEALALEAREAIPDRSVLAVLDAGRGGIYAATYAPDGTETRSPALLTIAEAVELARHGDPVLAGSGVAAVMAATDRRLTVANDAATADIQSYARIAADRGLPGMPASPLYLRQADAKPQLGFALPRKSVE